MVDEAGVRFRIALAEAARVGGLGSVAEAGDPLTASLPFAPPSFDDDGVVAGGPERWDAAMSWIADAAQVDRADDESDDKPETIAAEIGLCDGLTPEEIAQRWRRFVWRNHPDRQPLDRRARATQRVAIANMLVDRLRRGPGVSVPPP